MVDAADSIWELPGSGTDTVIAGFSYVLGDNLENLVLTGSADLNGTGNALANVLTGNAGSNVLTGLGGNDSYYVDSAGDTIVEAGGGGSDTVFASLSWVLAPTQSLENLTLTGLTAVNGTGNGLANILTGNKLGNVLDGLLGADTMAGGLGNDTYVVDNAGDVVTELAGQGTDTVSAGVNYTLSANIERMVLTGAANIAGTGNGLDNQITGNVGNNKLDGGVGVDTLIGGLGNDTYFIDNAGDKAAEAMSEGIDQVNASVSFTLGSNVENLLLTGTGDLTGTGNGLDNVLWGNDGDNVLNGMTGADKMLGGLGNDTYYVDSVFDQATDVASGGIDIVLASNSHILSQYIENLTLTGSANITATGNALDNILIGNAGGNRLTGGLGADSMTGGAGNDTYYVDNIADTTTEAANQGIDLVQSTVTYTLSNNVENLFLNGTANLNGTGNALANLIIGNDGNNVLDGKAGVDKLFGGAGNDTFYIDNASDSAKDDINGGMDLVISSVSVVLTANIENLTLTGSANVTGTGNMLANVLIGNDGINKLDGGAGNDTLTGGLGADVFVFGAGSGQDVVTDFSAAQHDLINVKAYSHGVVGGGGIVVSQVGGDTLIDFGGGNTVTIDGALKADVMSHMGW